MVVRQEDETAEELITDAERNEQGPCLCCEMCRQKALEKAAPELADALENLQLAIWNLADQQAMPDESWKTADDAASAALRKAGRLP